MPNPQPEAEQTKRPHYCSKLSTERNTERTERDADGCCKECGVPLDEDGYEAVDTAKEAQLKRLAAEKKKNIYKIFHEQGWKLKRRRA